MVESLSLFNGNSRRSWTRKGCGVSSKAGAALLRS